MDTLVLIIDQDEIERRYIATVLAADGFDVIQVGNLVEGMVQEMAHEPALIVVAEETSPVRVDDVVALIRRLSNAPVIVVGDGGDSGEIASLRSGGDYYLARPFRGAELSARARLLIQRAGSDVREIGLQPVRPLAEAKPGRVA
jgi:DNA-binding response OmpR family regulator